MHNITQSQVNTPNINSLSLSRSLCRTIKDFVIKIGSAMEDVEEGQQATVLQYKCSVLNEKLNRLLDIINRDIVNVESGNSQVRLIISNHKCSYYI